MTGTRGPKSAPASLHLLRGNPGNKKPAALLDEFKPNVEIPDCPQWLWEEARAEWDRITPELETYGLISKIDRAALVLYCQAWSEYVWAKRTLGQKMQFAAEGERLAMEQGKEWKGGDGFMIPTVNGNFAYSPYWVAARRAGDEVNKYLIAFGMSPAARARVQQSDQYEYLPGMEPGGENAGGSNKPTLASFAR